MDLSLLTVELAACAWILCLLLAELAVPRARASALWGLALAGIAVCAVFLWRQGAAQRAGIVQGMFAVDAFGRYFKALLLITAGAVVVMTREFHRHQPAHAGAFYLLFFTAVLGTLVLASIHDLLLLFLGLELLTFSLYIMAAYLKTDARSVEAGMKYLILGSVSSGFLVYGIALIYGAVGSTGFDAIRAAASGLPAAPTLQTTGAAQAGGPASLPLQAGLLLVLAGLGFKVAAVPFHLWVPDVYEGAPIPVVAFLSVGSKMAGVVAILRVLYEAFLPMQGLWSGVLAALSAATMCYGNLAAIPQTNIKRLLGYSSIGHAGYLLMGLSTGTSAGVSSVAFYLLAYLVSNLTAFLVVTVVSHAVGGDRLEDYRGLSKRSGWLSAAMFLGLLSLAGVPPLAGFVGKLFVLLRTVESGRLWLVAIGAINVVISLYYYLLVVKRMYLDPPASPAPIRAGALVKATAAALILGIFAVGIFQEPFVGLLPSLN